MKDGICPKCGSQNVMPNLPLVDLAQRFGAPVGIALTTKLRSLFDSGEFAALHAWVCGDCGYTELFVHKPQTFWAMYAEAKPSDQADGPNIPQGSSRVFVFLLVSMTVLFICSLALLMLYLLVLRPGM